MDDRSVFIPAERRKKIIEYIEHHKSAQIHELAQAFGVSEATVRRDLDDLDRMGDVKRTHGGAMHIDRSTSFERIHSEKISLMTDEKRRIAERAAQMVSDGDSVLLDSGTTTYYIAQRLSRKKNLTVITNDLYLAAAATLDESSTLMMTGGVRRRDYQVLVGSVAENFIRDTRVNIAFIGADGLDENLAVTNANFQEVEIKRLMVRAGMQTVLVCDSTKFDCPTLAKVCDISAFTCVVTDKGISHEALQRLQKAHVNVMIE